MIVKSFSNIFDINDKKVYKYRIIIRFEILLHNDIRSVGKMSNFSGYKIAKLIDMTNNNYGMGMQGNRTIQQIVNDRETYGLIVLELITFFSTHSQFQLNVVDDGCSSSS